MTEKCFEERFRDVEENYKVITNRIAEAAVRSGRKPENITFLAATKTVPAEVINHAIGCGLRFIGENRVQEFMDKYEKIDWDKGVSGQIIGRLQTNKVKYIIDKVDCIQSVDSVKLAKEIGAHKAANELGIPKGTMYTWIKAFKEGRLSANEAVHTPKNALSLNDELIELRKRVKEQDKEIRRLKEENEFLEEASAFFAASRRKSAKNRD